MSNLNFEEKYGFIKNSKPIQETKENEFNKHIYILERIAAFCHENGYKLIKLQMEKKEITND